MATQNSNDSNKIVQTSQSVTNSGSLNGIIRDMNEDYLIVPLVPHFLYNV